MNDIVVVPNRDLLLRWVRRNRTLLQLSQSDTGDYQLDINELIRMDAVRRKVEWSLAKKAKEMKLKPYEIPK